jgi:hypothetical protein
VVDTTNLTGVEHVISVTANPSGVVHFRVYTVQLMKSGQRIPRVELQEMGPSIDFTLRRKVFANDDMMKQATRVPKELKVESHSFAYFIAHYLHCDNSQRRSRMSNMTTWATRLVESTLTSRICPSFKPER